jgi:hypothetical protein
MSDTMVTLEATLATELFDLSLDEAGKKLSLKAIKSSFAPFKKRPGTHSRHDQTRFCRR